MNTSIVLFALSGVFGPGMSPNEPSWLGDYGSAQQLGRAEQKPLAVFLGSGPAGWRQLSREGRLGEEAKRVLVAEYVCVYLDTAQSPGKRLATAFDMPSGPGIVISDRTGDLQAFRHAGDLGDEELVRYLRRYADPDRVVRRTESNPPEHLNTPAYQPAPAYYNSPRVSYPVYTSGGC
jgi:hypothetical protein